MPEIITRYLKLAVLVVLVWVGLAFWSSCGYKTLAGGDMSPTIAQNSNLWVLKQERSPEQLQVGDIVFFEYRQVGVNRPFAARVMGLPGNRVRMEKGECYVDGQKADSAYVLQGARSDDSFDEITVPRDCVYLLMDNRRQTAKYDSRSLGPIGAGAILCKVKK